MSIIYKITSPTNRIYIGQTKNKETRFSHYKKLNCKGQPLLYRSLLKYGWDNHKFEILKEGNYSKEILNVLEKHYISFYKSYIKGMNCTSGGTDCEKFTGIKRTRKGFTKEYKENMSIIKSKKLIDLNTNIIYNSLKEAATAYNMNPNTLCNQLKGRYPNKTSLTYLK